MIYNINNNLFILFKKNNNVIMSKFDKLDIEYFLYHLDEHVLDYRKKINISDDITFGFDIGYEKLNSKFNYMENLKEFTDNILKDNNWKLNYSRYSRNENSVVSPMYTDNEKKWADIESMCRASYIRLDISDNAVMSVNIGSDIFGNNTLYWYRLLKLWGIYENIIYRFSYGEYLSYFPLAKDRVKPVGDIILTRLEYYKKYINSDTFNLICNIFPIKYKNDTLNKNSISFYNMFDDFDYSKKKDDLFVSFRIPVSTFNYIILQNYVNFFVHLMLYCKSDKFNDDILDKRIRTSYEIIGNIDNYDKIYLDQALELCDMIYDNLEDKVYFLKQYLKGTNEYVEKNEKARKFTRKLIY